VAGLHALTTAATVSGRSERMAEAPRGSRQLIFVSAMIEVMM
jgi:hypothetical protein